jgi:formate/nitrite transporter FocA (FNT family)
MFAGAMIALAAIINLHCANPVVGAFLFSLGLLSIVHHGAKLYTGMTGYWLEALEMPADGWIDRLNHLADALVATSGTLMLNTFGALFIATINTYMVQEKAAALIQAKAAMPWYHLIGSGVLCGMLMLLAVKSYKTAVSRNNPVVGIVILIMCVAGFILAGLDHSIANIAYVAIARIGGIESVRAVMLPVVGNFIGGSLLYMLWSNMTASKGYM